MVAAFVKQLHKLEVSCIPTTFDQSAVAENLTHLNLTMNSNITSSLPRIRALPLQSLMLFDVPRSFTWKAFYSDSPGSVAFTNLRALLLYFRLEPDNGNPQGSIDSKLCSVSTADRDEDYRQLCFPRLETLVLGCSPYRDAGFYKLFANSPLRSLHIGGTFESMKHMDGCVLLNLQQLVISLFNASEDENSGLVYEDALAPDDYEHFSTYLKNLLASPSSLETALIHTIKHDIPLSIPGSIGWANIKSLLISANVYFSSVMNFVAQCPNLHKFDLLKITNDLNDTDTGLVRTLALDPTSSPCSRSKLDHFSLYALDDGEPQTSLKMLIYMALAVRSLKSISVPGDALGALDSAIAECSTNCPCPANVRVLFNSNLNPQMRESFYSTYYRISRFRN
ncbi:hypothetical protein GGI12_005263 [Dipsacomyces acuminosporus]|nr:hypothetical protein GGI12_005263 [Dipsacomyces acuminosporus]